jgi:BirA family transcriptional regulator, biotin operon repressor / biotin---[acetyl-CoA-carboxylase] ligase
MGLLAPEAVVPLLRGRFGRPYAYGAECESTQLLLLDSGLPEGAVAVTEHQTGGRGRHGRPWVAPPRSSLLFSVLLRPPLERSAPELSLVAALAVTEAVGDTTGAHAQVKWPNDVLVEGRKVAGILAELRGHVVVVGIGVNVRQAEDELPADAPTTPGSLRSTTGAEVDRAALLVSVLDRLERAYGTWREGGLSALHPEIEARDFLRGRKVTLDGRELTARRILPDGRLEVEAPGGEVRALGSGEVRLGRL